MSELNNHLRVKITDSKTENVAVYGGVRVSVLTEKMFRVEVSKDGEFCDLPTQKVWHRAFANPKYDIAESSKHITIKTDFVTISINKNGSFANAIFKDGRKVTSPNAGNLKGTCRTLDGTVGAVPLEDGVLSKNGVAILDDSNSLLYNSEGELCEKPCKNRDYYIFAYGYNYREAIVDFYKLSGRTPLMPKFVLGNWWSRYRAYTQEEYLGVMDNFIKRNIPLTIATVDMDWHLVNGLDNKYRTGNIYPWECTGWTGYTWNEELFPDYKQFLNELHSRNLKVTLNLHPARGVRGYEVMYKDMAVAMGVDYQKEEPVNFDLTNPKFVNNYFDIVHHPYEKEGVDFWWIDWQQGKNSKVAGLDPLYALNHYHTLDNGRDNKRGLILSRYAGIGSHRYPLGFSGDTNTTWRCLNFQPYFTAIATNCGYSWWSHDIGGHHFGEKDDELYLRWIQFGVFSPIMRLHSTQNDIMGKEPWNYSSITEEITSDYLRFRHSLIPFLYTMNMRTHKDGIGLIEPLYYDNPQDKRAYDCKNSYLFGGNLIVAPITEKTDKYTLTAKSKVFLPAGRWTDIFTGRVYNGDCAFNVHRDIRYIPVFAKEGSILPLAECSDNNIDNPQTMRLWVYSGNGEFDLYEDDGISYNYQKGEYVTRKFAVEESGKDLIFEINSTIGDSKLFADRKFVIDFKDIKKCDKIEVLLNDNPVDVSSICEDFVEVEITLKAQDKLLVKLIDFDRIDNGTINENIVRIFSKYQYGNTAKTAIYNKFKKVKNAADLQKALSGVVGHCRLKSVLKELLYMKF